MLDKQKSGNVYYTMKHIVIIGSGICGLKLASILSEFREIKITLISDEMNFLFYPLAVDMLYHKQIKRLNVLKFCDNRGITYVNAHVSDITDLDHIFNAKGYYRANKEHIIDCTNIQRRLLDEEKESTYSENILLLKNVLDSTDSYNVYGSGIQAFEISKALNRQLKLLSIKGKRSIITHPLIEKSWFNQKEFEHIEDSNISHLKVKSRTSLITGSTYPNSAQEASRRARRIAIKILSGKDYQLSDKYKSRGVMVKYNLNNSRIYIGSGKLYIDGRLANTIRKAYYTFQLKTFYSTRRSITLLIYLQYLKFMVLLSKLKDFKI